MPLSKTPMGWFFKVISVCWTLKMGSEPNFDVMLLSAELAIVLNSDLTPFLACFHRDTFEFTGSDALLPLSRAGDMGAGAA